MFRSGLVSTCFGCRRSFPKPSVAPYDLVIKHKDHQGYTAPDGTYRQRYGNVYYHVSLTCVTARQSSFNPANLVVPSEVKAMMTPTHDDYLMATLGVSIN
jgi:hypothetical protein